MGSFFESIAVTASPVLLFTLLLLFSRVSVGTAKLRRVEAKLDLLLQNAGISYDPHKDLPAACVQALQSGNKIAAIKEFRTVTGAGLEEAKDVIEAAQSEQNSR